MNIFEVYFYRSILMVLTLKSSAGLWIHRWLYIHT